MSTSTGKRVGRPRNPPRPHVHASYEGKEFADRLQAILDAIEIDELEDDARLYLQKRLRHCDLARSIDPKATKGEEKVTVLLRTVFESRNGQAALKVPILDAVADCLLLVWVNRGLAWIEAFDHIDLVGLHATLRGLGIADQLSRAIYHKLEGILGPPAVAPMAKPGNAKDARSRRRGTRHCEPILQAAA